MTALLLALLSTALTQTANETTTDQTTGLKIAPGWQLVRAHCGGCHSLKLVSSQRGDRTMWLNTIRWMQEKQNLWPIPEEQEQQILDYLATAYAAQDWGRRPPLRASLMPSTEPSAGRQ